jgi:hypothetical protein
VIPGMGEMMLLIAMSFDPSQKSYRVPKICSSPSGVLNFAEHRSPLHRAGWRRWNAAHDRWFGEILGRDLHFLSGVFAE